MFLHNHTTFNFLVGAAYISSNGLHLADTFNMEEIWCQAKVNLLCVLVRLYSHYQISEDGIKPVS
jgi:hypothetical protein